jgi:hypothetical protein
VAGPGRVELSGRLPGCSRASFGGTWLAARPPQVACGRSGWWWVCCCVELEPGMLPGPVGGQVNGDAAGVAGEPPGQVDQCRRMVAGRAVA